MSFHPAKDINDATLDLEGLEVNLNLLARIATDERVALDLLLVGQGGACQLARQLPAWSDSSGQEESSIQKLKERVA